MRRLILWNLITLDGYFQGPEPWDLDWHNEVWSDELEEFSLEQLASAYVPNSAPRPGHGRPLAMAREVAKAHERRRPARLRGRWSMPSGRA